jgi:tRNA nucleotidyltransferase (CCA-adding enzyme)
VNINLTIPSEVNEILEILTKKGYEAYIVGGCVRDSILGRNPHDWDICTSAKPDEVIEIFKNYRVIETGLQHGTVTVMLNNTPFEITTYRIDGVYSDNRRPDNVEFTTDIKEDLSRRDFTVNAMAYSPKVGLIDPFNGIYDIEMKLIRCVNNASDRFQEDSLRILRAMRFSIQLDFMIDKSTYDAMLNYKSLIKNVSAERINSELVKMLSANKPIIKHFQSCRDIIAKFIPEFTSCFDFQQNNPYHEFDVYNHILRAVDSYDGIDLIIKLSLLFHDIGKPDCYSEDENGGHFIGHGIVSSDKVNEILRRLKFDNETIKLVTELVLYHDSSIEPKNKIIKRWLNKIGEQQFRRLIEIRTADILGQTNRNNDDRLEKQKQIYELLDVIVAEEQCFTIKELEVNGNELLEIGYKQGRQLGSALQGLLDCVIANEVDNNKEELLQLARKWLNN